MLDRSFRTAPTYGNWNRGSLENVLVTICKLEVSGVSPYSMYITLLSGLLVNHISTLQDLVYIVYMYPETSRFSDDQWR
jgi:hypothetical protein